jgi:hypothetical protein
MSSTASAAQLREQDYGVVSGFGCTRRLSEATRQLAATALASEWGRQMRKAEFALDPEQVRGLSPNRHYAQAVRLMAERAPLRVVTGERLVGAATLLEASEALFHRLHNAPEAQRSRRLLDEIVPDAARDRSYTSSMERF